MSQDRAFEVLKAKYQQNRDLQGRLESDGGNFTQQVEIV